MKPPRLLRTPNSDTSTLAEAPPPGDQFTLWAELVARGIPPAVAAVAVRSALNPVTPRT